MNETLPSSESPDILKPGNVICLADITELVAFEDTIASVIDPKYNNGFWEGRPHLRDTISPPKFNGRIANIELEVMDEPYERLQDARQRGWVMHRGHGNFKLTSELAGELKPRYRGFVLLADAISTGRGVIGQIQCEMWYYPTPTQIVTRKAGTVVTQKRLTSSGKSEVFTYVIPRDYKRVYTNEKTHYGRIKRVITKPKMETEKFIKLDEAAKLIGLSVLKKNITHPLRHTMRE